MKKTLVMGVGNLLLSDDGVGIHAIHHLQDNYQFSEEVQLLDGGTCGLDLLHFLEGIDRLIIIDAAQMGKPSGTVVRLEGDQIPAHLSLKTSPHEINLPELLFAAKLADLYPAEVIVLGVQPKTIETNIGLSAEVQNTFNTLIQGIVKEVNN